LDSGAAVGVAAIATARNIGVIGGNPLLGKPALSRGAH
jgi:hypothetical protein